MADTRNLKRGWASAVVRAVELRNEETSKASYSTERVTRNNERRVLWAENGKEIWG